MALMEVYDPPMCCTSGVCGPEPDADLIRFSADLDWLRSQGAQVRRYNLSQEPNAFIANAVVKQLLETTDGEALPVIVADGTVVAQGVYPSRADLSKWAGLGETEPNEDAEMSNDLVTPQVGELIALGAAVASNCESCFEYHFTEAGKLGVSNEDMVVAVNIALQVKEAPARNMVQLAKRLLLTGGAASGGCCGDSTSGCC